MAQRPVLKAEMDIRMSGLENRRENHPKIIDSTTSVKSSAPGLCLL